MRDTVPFGEIATFRNGLNFGSADSGTTFKVLGIPDFWNRSVLTDFSSVASVALSAEPPSDDLLRDEDLVFVRSNGSKALVGRCLLVYPGDQRVAFSGFTIRARLKSSEFDPRFIALLFQSPLFDWHRWREGAGTNISNLSQDVLASFGVPCISIREQRRIAEILRAWDEAIEKTERLIAAKEAALIGHMHVATRDAELEALGEGWVRATLADVTHVAIRRVEWDEAATYRRITVRRACGGLSLRGDALGREILTKDMYVVKAGDFVISRRQVIHGAWAMARDEFDNTHVSKEYACLTARADRLWMPYLDWLSRTPRLRHEAVRCSYGVDPEKMVLNLDWLLKTPLALPATIERQRKLAEFLDCAQAEITLLKKQRDAFAKQKRGLMQKLLTGEWQVAVPRSQEAAE